MTLSDFSQNLSPKEKTLLYSMLVIENSPLQGLSLRTLLEVEGFEIDVVGEGQTAIEQFQTQAYDLVLINADLPTMDSYEICRRLKANPITAHIPVLIFTCEGHPIDTLSGLKVKVVDFICDTLSEIGISLTGASLIDLIHRINKGANLC